MQTKTKKLKVLELFSGIGGMHWALKEAQKENEFEFEIMEAIDICDNANAVYKSNFPDVNVKARNICGLSWKELSKLQIEAIFMSPPCQPFTRQGLQKDTSDHRTQPLLHIVDEILPNVESLKYILMENVKGFEVSEAHASLMDGLHRSGFKTQEYLLCPRQLGIPNSRLRYYLIASKNKLFESKEQLISNLQEIKPQASLQKFIQSDMELGEYLNLDPGISNELLKVDEKILEKHAEVLDIVNSHSKVSCCFTKAYGKYAKGTGTKVI